MDFSRSFFRSSLVKFAAFLLLISGSYSGVWGQTIVFDVAVLDFEINDINNQVPNAQAMGRSFAQELGTALDRSNRFKVYERARIDAILSEYKLTEDGLASNPDDARQFGNFTGVKFIVTGTVTVNSPTSYRINARFINVDSSQNEYAAASSASSLEEFEDAAKDLVAQVLPNIPLLGLIHLVSQL